MIAPTSAPPIGAGRATPFARDSPSHAVSALTPIAHGSAATIAGARAGQRRRASSGSPIHSTAAAVAGTEMLSSSRTGSVSTSAASNAAASGATIVNVDRRHRRRPPAASTTRARLPPTPPKTMKASVPATVLSRFHGRRPTMNAELANRRKILLCVSASSAFADAADERRGAVAEREDAPRRRGDVEPRRERRASAAAPTSGYSRMPSGNPRAWSTGRYSRVPPMRGSSSRLKTSAAAASAAACQPGQHSAAAARTARTRCAPTAARVPSGWRDAVTIAPLGRRHESTTRSARRRRRAA